MILKEFDINNYLFGMNEDELTEREKKQIYTRLRREMQEIFYGRNMN
jgi:S-adenosylmethionine decarboxylase